MRASLRVALLCAAPLLYAGGAAAQTPPLDVRVGDLRAKLGRELNQIAASFDGAIGIAVKDFTSGDVLAVNADTIFPQASSIKVAVLIELLRQGELDAAIMALPFPEHGLTVQPLYDEEFVVALPKHHRWADRAAIEIRS